MFNGHFGRNFKKENEVFKLTSQFRVSLAILMFPVVLATIACHARGTDELTGTERTNKATVKGTPDQLKKFADSLRQLAGTRKLDEVGIGCDKCDHITNTDSTLQLAFIREPKDQMMDVVMKAWDAIDKEFNGDPLFHMQIKGFSPSTVCSTPSGTCKNANYCEPLTGGCDKFPSGPGCQLCN